MVFFRILIKKILNKLSIKNLLLIGIFLMLLFFCMGKEIFAATFDYTSKLNNQDYFVEYYTSIYNVLVGDSTTGQPKYYLYIPADKQHGNSVNVDFLGNNTIRFYRPNTDAWFYNSYVYNNGTYTQQYVGYNRNSYFDISNCVILRATYNVVEQSNSNLYLEANTWNSNYIKTFTEPSFVDDTTIPTWSFDNLSINSGSITPYWVYNQEGISNRLRDFNLEITYQEVVYTLDLDNYITTYDNDYAIFTIPKNVLSNNFNIYNGNTISFDLIVNPDDEPNSTGTWSSYSLGTYTLTLTAEEQEQINNDSTKQVIGAIDSGINNLNNSITNLDNTQQETNNKIDELNNNLTSTNVDTDEAEGLFSNFGEGMIITDNTHLEQLFTMLYNAFCNNEVVGVHFTLPFVNKEVTIDSTTISAFYPQQVVTIANLFVWGMIGLYIIKDIRTMINKTAEGNIENISSDVKKEVL